jgi:UDP-N-acetylmuramoyl-tripeptide--D-alanyl-D-alanine ligase
LAIVERDVQAPAGLTLLKVESTLGALGALAHLHLSRWRSSGTVIAVTGSAGKTTTKHAIAGLLEAMDAGPIYASPGNLNNRIGVPLSALCVTQEHRYAVLELGTNRPGEIAALARILRPDVALLTLVAAAHTEGLGDIDAVAEEKGSLLSSLAPHGHATAIGNGDDPRVSACIAACAAPHKILYGTSTEHDYHIAARSLTSHDRSELALVRPDASRIEVELPVIGQAGALATVAAVAAAEAVTGARCDPASLGRAFQGRGLDGRLGCERLPGGVILIDDSYNANPASSRASLAAAAEVAQFTGGRLVLVLGEMRELGSDSADAHRVLGQQVAATGAACLIAVAGDAQHMVDVAAAGGVEASFFDDAQQAARFALEMLRDGDVVLVKGSRSIRTERVADALRARGVRVATPPARDGKCGGISP